LGLCLFLAPALSSAQTTHEVMVNDNSFSPPLVTIEPGDTVRWVNRANGGNDHNVVSADDLWTPPAIAESWTFEHIFNSVGLFEYFCAPHSLGMRGNVSVRESTGMDIDPGHSGNWWNGPDRSGEGAQIEVADGGGGDLVFVATVYSYGPQGGQIFLIAVGTPDGDSVTVDVFITDGGVWGDDFDPDDIVETQWGTGEFSASDCESITMTLTPNGEYAAMGYTVLSYDLVRLTTPEIPCPLLDAN
jgi:plastocyanin